ALHDLPLGHFGAPNNMTRMDGDTNGDADVDLDDLTRLLSNFGNSCL
ncbi:MAG: hypothetical protein HZB38_10745, partial [Planctomycetes bacterium]|nr:hypothetical protein [Planctomycetota bacterium]